MQNLADLRKDYTKATLDVSSVLENPIEQFKKWFDEAAQAEVPEPNAMILATVNQAGNPISSNPTVPFPNAPSPDPRSTLHPQEPPAAAASSSQSTATLCCHQPAARAEPSASLAHAQRHRQK